MYTWEHGSCSSGMACRTHQPIACDIASFFYCGISAETLTTRSRQARPPSESGTKETMNIDMDWYSCYSMAGNIVPSGSNCDDGVSLRHLLSRRRRRHCCRGLGHQKHACVAHVFFQGMVPPRSQQEVVDRRHSRGNRIALSASPSKD